MDLDYKKNIQLYSGELKFFLDSQNYGFIVCDFTKKDVFFHFDDLKYTGLSR